MNKKFLIGTLLIISNFILGKIALPLFGIWFGFGLSLYTFSWLILIIGLILCGKEGLSYTKGWYRKLFADIQVGWKEIKKKRRES